LTIRATDPDMGIVVLSQHNDPDYAMTLFRDGTQRLAYLLKQRVGEPAELIRAVREVADGGSVIDPEVVLSLVARSSQSEVSRLTSLTDREHDVLEQRAQGRTNAAVAAALCLSESSIEKYSTSIFAKLGLADKRTPPAVSAVLAYLDEQGRAKPL